jgi:uncharacterized protein (TIGR02302 family)
LSDRAVSRRIERAVALCRLALAAETLWPPLLGILGVVGLFAALSWLGAFAALPPIGRAILLALLAAGLFAAVGWVGFVASRRNALWGRAAALTRLERENALLGRPLVGLTDHLPEGRDDPATLSLWAAHRRRLAASLGRLAVPLPRPDLGRRDRWALRPLLAMALFAGWFAASDDHLAPLRDAFRFEGPTAAPPRLDVWIDPPDYTGQPALVLTGTGASTRDPSTPVTVPKGSRLVLRAAGAEGGAAPRLEVSATPATALRIEEAPPAPPEPTSASPSTSMSTGFVERRFVLEGDGEITVSDAGRRAVAFPLVLIPDTPPRITLVEPPSRRGSGATRLVHDTDDDWGVVSAEAIFTAPPGGRALYDAPRLPLVLPAGRAHRGRAETLRDLSAHPFAGARLTLRLVARDAAGQEGASTPVEVTLPERRFRDTVARALAEQRRRLALDAREIGVVLTTLEALTLAPEHFEPRFGRHLALRALAADARRAKTDDDLRSLTEALWSVALQFETGNGGKAAEDLAKAIEALRNALRDGASEEEIARLTEELRKAVREHLQAQADAARRDPSKRGEAGGKEITGKDLDRMLDRIEKLGRTGSRDGAEQLLSELDDLLSKLQPQGGGKGSAQGGGGGDDTLDRLGDMMRRQRKLMDETHKGDRQGGDADALQRDQKALRRDLDELSKELGPGGKPREGGEGGEDPGSALDEAGREMGEAGDALGRGEGEEALGSQGKALDAMRRGAKALAEARKSGAEDGPDGEEDPLGRPKPSKKGAGHVDVPDEIATERARRVLEDIRRRLADPALPRLEHDYLDRLLKLD